MMSATKKFKVRATHGRKTSGNGKDKYKVRQNEWWGEVDGWMDG